MTHDYKWNGTTTLFAALNTLDEGSRLREERAGARVRASGGTVISETMQRHRHNEWLKFLKRLHRETPKHLALHIICDNYATHKHPTVKAWLETHKRIHVHFTPTSSSWLNMVERFFRDITENRIRRGVFRSVPELEAAIHTYIANHNAAPKPFIWTAVANDILAKVARARKVLDVARISGDLHEVLQDKKRAPFRGSLFVLLVRGLEVQADAELQASRGLVTCRIQEARVIHGDIPCGVRVVGSRHNSLGVGGRTGHH